MGKYDETVDNVSAYEVLTEKAAKEEQVEAEAAEAEKTAKEEEKRKEKIQKELMDVGVKVLKRGLLNTLLKKR